MRAYLWAEGHRLGLLLEATGCSTCRARCFSKARLFFPLAKAKFLHKSLVSLIVLGTSECRCQNESHYGMPKKRRHRCKILAAVQQWLELAACVMRFSRTQPSGFYPIIFFPPISWWQTSMSHFGFLFSLPRKVNSAKVDARAALNGRVPGSVYFATRPHEVRVGSTQMRLSLEKVIGWRLQWQGFPLRDEYTIGPRGACWKRAFSLQVAPCGNSISGVVGGPQLGLSVGV